MSQNLNQSTGNNSTICGESIEDDNITEHQFETFDTSDIIYYTYYYLVFFLLTVVNILGNGLVIVCVIKYRHLQVPNNYFILSLAFSDFLLGLIYPTYNISHMLVPEILNTLGSWRVCSFLLTMSAATVGISAYSLVAITMVRYISILDPFKFSLRVTPRKSFITIALIWLIPLAISVGFYSRLNPPCHYKKLCRYELIMGNYHLTSLLIISHIVPIFIMGMTYVRMIGIVRRNIVAPFAINSEAHKYLMKREMKMFRVAGFLVGYFAVAWLPFTVFGFVAITCGSACSINRYIRATSRLVLHSNSAVNVIVYAGRMKAFREVFRKELRCFLCKREQNLPLIAPTVQMQNTLRDNLVQNPARSDFGLRREAQSTRCRKELTLKVET